MVNNNRNANDYMEKKKHKTKSYVDNYCQRMKYKNGRECIMQEMPKEQGIVRG